MTQSLPAGPGRAPSRCGSSAQCARQNAAARLNDTWGRCRIHDTRCEVPCFSKHFNIRRWPPCWPTIEPLPSTGGPALNRQRVSMTEMTDSVISGFSLIVPITKQAKMHISINLLIGTSKSIHRYRPGFLCVRIASEDISSGAILTAGAQRPLMSTHPMEMAFPPPSQLRWSKHVNFAKGNRSRADYADDGGRERR